MGQVKRASPPSPPPPPQAKEADTHRPHYVFTARMCTATVAFCLHTTGVRVTYSAVGLVEVLRGAAISVEATGAIATDLRDGSVRGGTTGADGGAGGESSGRRPEEATAALAGRPLVDTTTALPGLLVPLLEVELNKVGDFLWEDRYEDSSIDGSRS